MATKAAHTAFNREVSKYLQSIGAEFELRNGVSGDGVIKTTVGILNVSLREAERTQVFSIFCTFDDKTRWDFHDFDARILLQEFKEQIQPLLIKTLTT